MKEACGEDINPERHMELLKACKFSAYTKHVPCIEEKLLPESCVCLVDIGSAFVSL